MIDREDVQRLARVRDALYKLSQQGCPSRLDWGNLTMALWIWSDDLLTLEAKMVATIALQAGAVSGPEEPDKET